MCLRRVVVQPVVPVRSMCVMLYAHIMSIQPMNKKFKNIHKLLNDFRRFHYFLLFMLLQNVIV